MPPSIEAGWSVWRRVPSLPALNAAVLAEILDGGQAFRWRQDETGWLGFFDRFVVRLKLDDKAALVWSVPSEMAVDVENPLAHYLQANSHLPALVDTLPWRSDPHLARCLAAFPGLRILRQPFGETLLGFLCSATKQIVQIKQMVALLAARHGAALFAPGEAPAPFSTNPAFRLPTWEEIAQLSEADLRGCLLGFRAGYIHRTAQFLAQNPGWLEATEHAAYPEAKERL